MQPKRVLIVEDEGLIANDIAGQLHHCGYQVAGISASAEEAFATIRQSSPDLVLMDVRLKGKLDGIEAAVQVRTEHHLPVIFLTSHADAETLSRAREAEPFGYLVKPFRQLNLSSAIEMALYKHNSEQALAQREAWLTTVLQSTGAPTIVTDAAGKVQFINALAETLFGLSLAQAAGLQWTQVAALFDSSTGNDADDLVALATLRLATLKLPAGTALRARNGNAIAVEGEVSPSVVDGEIAGAVLTIRDVSARQSEESELRKEQKMLALERMAGGIAHDFNNLLTLIMGNGSYLAESPLKPGDRLHLDAMMDAARSATEITQQLFTLSRKQLTGTEVLNVSECVGRMARLLAPSLGRTFRLKVEHAEDTGKVRMNTAQLDQILLNLVLNARDAMPQGGSIVISTSNVERVSDRPFGEITEHFVRLNVTDSGEGIPADVQEHLFEPFFTTKPEGKGTGLGLAIVYGIIKEVGGEIAVRSVPGEGACFDVLIPRVEAEQPMPNSAELHTSETPKTILLVEPQPGVRSLVHNYFEQQGFNLIGAADGQQALDLADIYEGSIDVVISDAAMPQVDGVTLSRQLRTGRPNLKVVLLCAAEHPLAKAEDLEAELLRKPFALPSLLARVQALTA